MSVVLRCATLAYFIRLCRINILGVDLILPIRSSRSAHLARLIGDHAYVLHVEEHNTADQRQVMTEVRLGIDSWEFREEADPILIVARTGSTNHRRDWSRQLPTTVSPPPRLVSASPLPNESRGMEGTTVYFPSLLHPPPSIHTHFASPPPPPPSRITPPSVKRQRQQQRHPPT
jgi:hypothetical protein